jgi:phage FluMu gp28-like protein
VGYFLPYQERWLHDLSRLKIWEKSRRIGATYVQAYEDVRDACVDDGIDVWFSSADESAAKEYILYCSKWAQVLNVAAQDLGELVLDSEKDIKALVIEFANGKRIHGLSSNPKAFRSKGGKLVLDEFAFHSDPEALWKAAAPIITWGFPARVLSTYNGKGNRYARMVADAKKGNKWRLHTVTIEDAIRDGLVERILGKPASHDEITAFKAECRDIAGDEETYQQEYLCKPVDEATAWLPWGLIAGVEDLQSGRPELFGGGSAFVGMDIARRRDLTVIWVAEQVGDVYWCREVVSLKKARFSIQLETLDRVIEQYKVHRVCMDQTGMGEMMVEKAQEKHGEHLVEGVLMTGPVKQDLATHGKGLFEDRLVRIPADRAIRESHHAVRKLTTSAGNPRFDADRSEVGHADEFWAHMLCLHAAQNPVEPWEPVSAPRESLNRMMRGY